MVWLGRVIILIGCGLYVGAIAYAGWLGWTTDGQPDLGNAVPAILTSLGGAFATVFGAAFGLSNSTLTTNSLNGLIVTEQRLRAKFSFPATATIIATSYFVALCVGVIFLLLDPAKDKAAEPIQNIWQTFLGVIAGVIYVQAGKKPDPSPPSPPPSPTE
jgi:arginine exporter protein ArgO